MARIAKTWKTDDYVYDISLDGTVVNALGVSIASNTDGLNYSMPPEESLATRHYVGKGLNRLVEKDKEYTGVEADLMEFNDLYMRGKMGLDIDEYCPSTINFSRKNYADLLDNGKVKLVGNTIKSKKMPAYIENFLNVAIALLLNGKGSEFIDEYYKHIERIYNLRIPLRQIASKGKIKKTLEEYKESCKQITAAGQKRSRQAWYELAIKHNLKVNLGETIYFINTGSKKSEADIKRVTHWFEMRDGEKVEITKEIDKAWLLYRKQCKAEGKEQTFKKKAPFIAERYPAAFDEDELIFNCVLLDREIVESDNDVYCSEDMEYNVDLYINKFNKRITPLLVCFHKEIRDQILITNPDDRNYFTASQAELCAGEPNKPTDQDTLEEIMTMSPAEIEFWMKIGEKPVFCDECGMDWEKMQRDYLAEKEKMKSEEIRKTISKYNEVISSLTNEEVNDFINEGTLPGRLSALVEIDTASNHFMSKVRDKDGNRFVVGSIYDILEKKFTDKAIISVNELKNEERMNSYDSSVAAINTGEKLTMNEIESVAAAAIQEGGDDDSDDGSSSD